MRTITARITLSFKLEQEANSKVELLLSRSCCENFPLFFFIVVFSAAQDKKTHPCQEQTFRDDLFLMNIVIEGQKFLESFRWMNIVHSNHLWLL